MKPLLLSVFFILLFSPFLSAQLNIGAEGGIIFSNLAKSGTLTDYKTGYYFGLFNNRDLKRETRLQGGISIYSLGGQYIQSNDNLRLNYISLPVDIEKIIWKRNSLFIQNVSLGIGAYGSYLLSNKAPIKQSVNDWDTGAKFRLKLQQGSFWLTLGYIRGFMDLFSGSEKSYTNAFQIGISLIPGN